MAADLNHPTTAAGLALHALGAGDPADQAALEEHLRDCDRCSQEVARLRDAVSLLAPVDRRDLDGCWERIASRVRAGSAS